MNFILDFHTRCSISTECPANQPFTQPSNMDTENITTPPTVTCGEEGDLVQTVTNFSHCSMEAANPHLTSHHEGIENMEHCLQSLPMPSKLESLPTEISDADFQSEYHPRLVNPKYRAFLRKIGEKVDKEKNVLQHQTYALTPIKACFGCNHHELSPGSHKQCIRCKLARYCSKQCQTQHWKSAHRQLCKEHGLEIAKDHISIWERLRKDNSATLQALKNQNPEYTKWSMMSTQGTQ